MAIFDVARQRMMSGRKSTRRARLGAEALRAGRVRILAGSPARDFR